MARRIAANYIFPVASKPIKNGIIEIDNTGEIIDIIDNNGELKEESKLEFHNGVIVPGFINAHCHLELSYLKNKVSPQTGLHNFIDQIQEIRNDFTDIEMLKTAKSADTDMYNNGIVAVGDISNSEFTYDIKQKSNVYYHTFIEVFSLNPDIGLKLVKSAKSFQLYKNKQNNCTIVPHAPYSVSNELFKLIDGIQYNDIISIHNQECESENELYINKSGKILEVLQRRGMDFSNFHATGKKSLESYLPKIDASKNILLIHNTMSEKDDVEFAEKYSKNIYWVLCTCSNIYIENRLPDFKLFENLKVALGTDSYASNTSLSILDEMKQVNANYAIKFNALLKWASLNGAKALKIDNKFGSLEIGKSPGLNLITNFDFKNMNIKDASGVKRLV